MLAVIAANTAGAAAAAAGLKATTRSRAFAAMAATAATRADCFVHAWRDRKWLTQAEYPSAPSSLDEMYETHLAIQQHPLVASEFGGHAGYKLGAIGAEGEPCLYAPLFNSYMVAAPGDGLSAASINLWQLEPEIGFVMGSDLPARADGAPHTAATAAAAVSKVVLCIELCGKRRTPDADVKGLGSYADTLSSGGVVMGPSLAIAGVSLDQMRCATELIVNGQRVAQGSGAEAPLGGPAEALAWLANHLNGRGLTLAKGHFVATGQTCNTKSCQPGDCVVATFEGLGRVEMVVAP